MLIRHASASAHKTLKSRAAAVSAHSRRTFATPTAVPPQSYDKLQEKDCSTVTPPYARLLQTLDRVRQVLPQGTKLTLAEKILYAHLRNPEECLAGSKSLADVRGQRYLKLRPDRVAMQVSVETSHSMVKDDPLTMCENKINRMHQLKWPCCNS